MTQLHCCHIVSSCARRLFRHFNWRSWWIMLYTGEWWMPVSLAIWHVVWCSFMHLYASDSACLLTLCALKIHILLEPSHSQYQRFYVRQLCWKLKQSPTPRRPRRRRRSFFNAAAADKNASARRRRRRFRGRRAAVKVSDPISFSGDNLHAAYNFWYLSASLLQFRLPGH